MIESNNRHTYDICKSLQKKNWNFVDIQIRARTCVYIHVPVCHRSHILSLLLLLAYLPCLVWISAWHFFTVRVRHAGVAVPTEGTRLLSAWLALLQCRVVTPLAVSPMRQSDRSDRTILNINACTISLTAYMYLTLSVEDRITLFCTLNA